MLAVANNFCPSFSFIDSFIDGLDTPFISQLAAAVSNFRGQQLVCYKL